MREGGRRSLSSFLCLRVPGSNPTGKSVDKNFMAVDRIREDLTENIGLDLGHGTSGGCQ